jgi:hypothetical protein
MLAIAIMSLYASPTNGQVVRTLPAADRELSEQWVEVYGVGAVDGEPWQVLAGVRAAVFDGQANLYVLDGDARILKFGPDGIFRGQIGSRGPGPGEVEAPSSLTMSYRGELIVGDRGAYHLFQPDGTYVSTVRPTEPAFSNVVVPVEGALVVVGGNRASMAAGREGRGLPLYRQPLAKGAPTEVIRRIEIPTTQSTKGVGEHGKTSFTFRRPPPYSPTVKLASLGPDRLALASATDWELQVLSADGSVLASLRRPIAARPSREADVEVLERRMRAAGDAVRTFGESGAALRVGPARPSIAETIPVIRDVVGDGKGMLFVARETDPVGGNEPLIDVVTGDGRYVGTIRGQPMPLALGPNRLAVYLERDDLDVERLVVRRLPVGWFSE